MNKDDNPRGCRLEYAQLPLLEQAVWRLRRFQRVYPEYATLNSMDTGYEFTFTLGLSKKSKRNRKFLVRSCRSEVMNVLEWNSELMQYRKVIRHATLEQLIEYCKIERPPKQE